MLKSVKTVAAAAAIGVAAFGAATSMTAAQTENTVMVGGAPMFPSKTIVDNAVNSKDHTTLVAAVKAAGLVDTLKSPGPFTVFAPVNTAFEKLPAGTVNTLLKPENKKTLTGVLTYHVVPGRFSAEELMEKAGGTMGKFTLKTVQGGTLTVEKVSDGKLSVTDSKGNKANITISNVLQSNGVIHVIDGVLLPS
jgi:uncharacterized surface protein with fasciclin (FAS1) repeats